MIIRKSLDSLAGKLIMAVGAIMTIGSVVFGYIFIRYEEKIMMNNLISYAASTADLVKRGIYYGMTLEHRKAIGQTIEIVGSGSGVNDISIFDKNGRVAYASSTTGIGKVFEKDSATCRICHAQSATVTKPEPNRKNWMIIKNPSGEKALRFAVPINNEPSCSNASCHYHPKGSKILGVLVTDFSTASVDETIRKNRIGTILFGALFVGMISVSLCLILYKFVSYPVALLDEGMHRISRGDLDYEIKIKSKDEMGLLADTFNAMTKDLKKYKEGMENWTKTLEEEVKKKTAEIMKTQENLINAEKLASLGRMAAGVAHELNSPLTGIVTFAHLMLKRIPPENAQDREDIEVIIEQANRCSKIIKGLLGFSRKATTDMIPININALTESTIALVRNQAKFYNIKFNLDFHEPTPQAEADPNQLQQVFLNLLINAADAMNEKGQITVATRLVSDTVSGKKFVEVEFTDSGPGIPEDHIGKIFEPFFTTKPVGKGTGLGLAVSYGIIKKHGGNIFVRSEAGKGASFFVRLPAEEISIG